MTRKEVLISWLNDAYGMENALVQVLDSQVGDAENHPQVQAKIQEHLRQTKRHADLVKGCIERLGGSTSSVKSGMASLFGKVQGMATSPAQDTLVKDGISDFAAENFEIASYKALMAAAGEMGDEETVLTCRQILQDEEAMANWLEKNLPATVASAMSEMAGVSTR